MLNSSIYNSSNLEEDEQDFITKQQSTQRSQKSQKKLKNSAL